MLRLFIKRDKTDIRIPDISWGILILIFILMLGTVLAIFGEGAVLMSRFVYLSVDIPGIGLAVVCVLCLWFWVSFSREDRLNVGNSLILSHRPSYSALIALIAMVAGVSLVYHDYAFSMDEYMTRFQGQIFSAGASAGVVPPEWRDLGLALHHNFTTFDPESGRVFSSNYRPGMALIHAFFDIVGLGSYVSALFAAASILMVAAVARQIWPGSTEAPLVAALIVATSQQMIVAGFTSYAMSAHLFFNLLWLWLFLRNDRWGHLIAPWVGVLTAALHQVHMHAFFALPFLLTLLTPSRFRLLVYFGLVYLGGHLGILYWDTFALGTAGPGAAPLTIDSAIGQFVAQVGDYARLPGTYEFAQLFANLARFFAWQNLAIVPLIFIAVRRSDWPPAVRLLSVSIIVALLPYVILIPDQGHGWGYRYLHGLIGNVALIATAGWLGLRHLAAEDRRRAAAFVAAATAATLLVMMPLRAIQVERTVRPFADSSAYVEGRDVDVVVVDTRNIFYGWDLVRNDPFLANRPVVMDFRRLTLPAAERLCREHSLEFVEFDQLKGFGMQGRGRAPDETPAETRLRALLATPECRAGAKN